MKQFTGTDQMVGLELDLSDFVFGRVIKWTETDLELERIGRKGEYEGTAIYKIEIAIDCSKIILKIGNELCSQDGETTEKGTNEI